MKKRYTNINTYKNGRIGVDIIPILSPLANKKQRKKHRIIKRGEIINL